MAALIAGWLAGAAMAMLTTATAAALALRARDSALVERWIAREVPATLLAVPVFAGAVVAWTLIGLGAGVIYEVADMAARPDGLGGPSATFTIAAAALGVTPALLLGIPWPRLWWLWSAHAAAFAGLFGWLLPWLAGR